MKKSVIYFAIFSLLVAFTACEEYLFEESETRFTTSTLFETTEGLEKMIINLYAYERQLVRSGQANSYLGAHLYGERTTDLVIFAGGSDASVSRYTAPGPTGGGNNLLYNTYWSRKYYTIGRANEIIHYGRKLGEEANELVAEASFWRAYAYYGLFARFGRLYLSTEPITKDNLEELTFAPADSADIFQLMYDDLEVALNGLPAVPKNGMTGRIARPAAHHLKALVAAWAQDWQEVADNVDALEANPDFNISLVANPYNIFSSSDLYTSETLWALRFSNERGGGSGHRLGEQYVNAIAEEIYTHKMIGGELVKYNEENLGNQWGLAFPNKYLMSLYDEGDIRLDAYYKRYYTYQNPEALVTVPPAQELVDRESGLLIEHTTYNFSDEPYQVQIGDTIYGRDIFMATRVKIDRRRMLPSSLKLVDIWSKPITDRGSTASYKDVMIFRLSESFLLGAEAYMHLGDQAKAQYYFNKTYTRAGNDPIGTAVTFEILRDEHARELAFEGRRFEFLKRNGIWYDQMRSYAGDFTKFPGSSSPYDAASYGISDGRDPAFAPDPNYYFDFNGSDLDVLVRFNVLPIHKNWPIPQQQIDAMGPANFPQTEGY